MDWSASMTCGSPKIGEWNFGLWASHDAHDNRLIVLIKQFVNELIEEAGGLAITRCQAKVVLPLGIVARQTRVSLRGLASLAHFVCLVTECFFQIAHSFSFLVLGFTVTTAQAVSQLTLGHGGEHGA